MNKKWNISIIVLFVLAISSLLAILTFQNIKSIIQNNIENIFYQKSLYITKAWTELGLAISNWYWIWFEDKISQNGQINKNFNCKNCWFDLNISNRSRNLITSIAWDQQECTQNNAIQLKQWDSFVLPLFVDQRKISKLDLNKYESILPYRNKNDENISMILLNNNSSWVDLLLYFAIWKENYKPSIYDVIFKTYTWITKNKASFLITNFMYDTNNFNESQNSWNTTIKNKIQKFWKYPNFLIIKNPTHCPSNSLNPNQIIKITKNWQYNCKCPNNLVYSWNINACTTKNWEIVIWKKIDKSIKFCLKVWKNLQNIWVATNYFFIDSKWTFSNKQSSISAIKKIQLPSWIFNTAITNY